MRRVAILLAVVAAAAAFAVVATRDHRRTPQYVILVCLDAVRPDHLGCYGYGVATSPNIDDLAAKGFVFEDAVSQAPWTIPSIATILSSTFPCQHGARRTGGSRAPYAGLESNFIETLKSLGYQTALFTGGLAIKDKVPGLELTGSALTWLKKNLESRCLIVIHDYETHSPYVAAPECVAKIDPGYDGRFRYSFGDMDVLRKARVGRLGQALDLSEAEVRHIKALYDCQIAQADAAVGSLVDSLEAWDRLAQSMIVIFADHGEEFLEHGSIDHGQTVYEESIRVPLVIFCPALGTRGRRVAEQVGLIDIAPTVFDVLGIEKPPTFEGITMAPMLAARAKIARHPRRPCGIPATCLVAESIARRSERKALRCPPWKLIFDPFFGAEELYDISADPGETRNLIDARSEVASALADTLLVMEKYYPGGWCVAWRGGGPARVAGKVSLEGSLVEAVAHNFFPELDAETDSLATSADWQSVRFAAAVAGQWKGVEIRMAGDARATFDLRLEPAEPTPRSGMVARLGTTGETARLPITLGPERARVDRRDLRGLFAGANAAEWDCVVFWIEPGAEPSAKIEKEAELRKQLRAVGYLD